MLQQILGTGGISTIDASIKAWIEEKIAALRAGYDLYQDYYEGTHQAKVTDRVKKFLPKDLRFQDNFCDVVCDTLSERLAVIGFISTDAAWMEWAWAVWQANRMDGRQGTVHSEAIVKGDSYVLVDWDAERHVPRFNHQDPAMIVPYYNPETRQMEWASKKWTWIPNVGAKPVTRLNLYYPDRVEKYNADGNLWIPFKDDGDSDWPLPWLQKDGTPMGIPIVHFRNRTAGEDFGTSEIEGIIPLQDLLNKTLVDLVQILDTQAFAQRYTVGVTPPSTFDVTPGAVWALESDDVPNAKVGEFTAASPEGVLRTIEVLIQHIAGRTRTPQYLFHITGGIPSGEALKTAESGLVSKARQRQELFGNAWEDCIALALRVQNTYGEPVALEKGAQLEAVWKDPESRNELLHLQSLQAKAELGISQKQIWRELGYSADEIAQMEADKQDERVAETNIGAEILKKFERGEV